MKSILKWRWFHSIFCFTIFSTLYHQYNDFLKPNVCNCLIKVCSFCYCPVDFCRYCVSLGLCFSWCFAIRTSSRRIFIRSPSGKYSRASITSANANLRSTTNLWTCPSLCGICTTCTSKYLKNLKNVTCTNSERSHNWISLFISKYGKIYRVLIIIRFRLFNKAHKLLNLFSPLRCQLLNHKKSLKSLVNHNMYHQLLE